jgi:histone-lysine N-methyltransferase SETMAR
MVKGTTINGEVYLKTILRLKEALKRPSAWRQKNLLLSENCKVHKACNIQAVIQECGLSELGHPSYSPDLAPCDFFLFKKLKKKLGAQNLPPINELKTAVDAYFAERRKEFFLEGMRKLEKRCIKYISVKGSYVEI